MTGTTKPPEWTWGAGDLVPGGVRTPLSALFAYGAAAWPERDAVADGQTTYSFRTLELGAQRIAAALHAAGVAGGDRVLVLADKRALTPMLAGAIWKLGAVYVPIDPENPPARLRRIVGQVRPSLVIGTATAASAVAPGTASLGYAELAERAADDAAPRWTASPSVEESAVAYVIFTSGSTGAPKGVMISHRSLLDYFSNHNRVLRFAPGSRVFSLSPFHFDVSIEDTLLPLSVGAFVYQFRGIPLGPLIRHRLARERITHLIAVSTLLTILTGDGAGVVPVKLPALEMVMTGAEVCDPKIIDLWKRQMPATRVINAYGPTEATIVCLTHTIDAPEPARTRAYPIGRPLTGVSVRIVNDDGDVRAPGVDGELWVGGPQVMLGYLDQPEETARVIVEDAGVRYYRTGDICRFDAAGHVEFVGRVDDELKLAGRRIHLGEIRQLALSHPGVERAVTGVVEVAGRRQIALVVIGDEAGDVWRSVPSFLAANLPEYMRPGVMAVAPAPRLTSTGKTDEKVLIGMLDAACRRYGSDRYRFTAEGTFLPAGAVAS